MICTLGHSNITLEKFIELATGVDVIIDVRSHPQSRLEHFNRESLEQSLPAHGKRYEWEPGLGGWRRDHLYLLEEMAKVGVDLMAYSGTKFPKQRIARKTPKELLLPDRPAWTNLGFYDYQWVMTLPEFRDAAACLMARQAENIAIICCEALWWKCHRSMVSDYLLYKGVDTMHLPSHKMHSEAIGDRLERYRPEVIEAWGTRL